jgi:hypothetical protein
MCGADTRVKLSHRWATFSPNARSEAHRQLGVLREADTAADRLNSRVSQATSRM